MKELVENALLLQSAPEDSAIAISLARNDARRKVVLASESGTFLFNLFSKKVVEVLLGKEGYLFLIQLFAKGRFWYSFWKKVFLVF